MLASAELLVRGGERVGQLWVTATDTSRCASTAARRSHRRPQGHHAPCIRTTLEGTYQPLAERDPLQGLSSIPSRVSASRPEMLCDGADRLSRPDSRPSAEGNAALRGPHGISASKAARAGRRPRRKPARSPPGGAQAHREELQALAAPRLVVPRPSYRSPGDRAAADADHAARRPRGPLPLADARGIERTGRPMSRRAAPEEIMSLGALGVPQSGGCWPALARCR